MLIGMLGGSFRQVVTPQPPAPPRARPTSDVYQFVFTSVRGGSTSILSLAEIRLFDIEGKQVIISEANNPGGEYANPFELPQSAIDGNVQSKWLDTNFYGEATLRLHLALPVHVAQYELITTAGTAAAWNLKRDPTGWNFGILRGGETFEVLSTVAGFTPPDDRSTSYGRFYSIMPPAPPSPNLPSPSSPLSIPPPPLFPTRPFPPPYPAPPPHIPEPHAPPPLPTGDMYQFVFTSVRDPSTAMISLSEVWLYDANGDALMMVEALNPGGAHVSEAEGAASAIDNNWATKWLDTNFAGERPALPTVQLPFKAS